MWRGSANDLTSEELLDDAWQSEEEGEKKLDGCEEGDEGACGEAETWWKERKQVKPLILMSQILGEGSHTNESARQLNEIPFPWTIIFAPDELAFCPFTTVFWLRIS